MQGEDVLQSIEAAGQVKEMQEELRMAKEVRHVTRHVGYSVGWGR